MKKLTAIVAPLLTLSLILTGCGGKKNAADESASDAVAGTQANKLTEDQTDGALVSIKGVFGETTNIEGGIDLVNH